jgi:hypothetical protein
MSSTSTFFPHSWRWFVASLVVVALSITVVGCDEDEEPAGGGGTSTGSVSDYSADIAGAWSQLAYDRVKADGIAPPAASRIYGFVGVAMYEALVGGMPGYQSLEGQLNGLSAGAIPKPDAGQTYHWPTVASAAVCDVMLNMLTSTNSQAAIQATHEQWETAFADDAPADVIDRSHELGEAVAAAIISWKDTDGFATYNNCTNPVVPNPLGAENWVPTRTSLPPNPPPPPPGSPHQPCWGQVRMFVGSPVDPPTNTKPAYSEDAGSEMYNQALETYNTVNAQNPEYQAIAVFWADGPVATGTPPGHSMMLCRQVVEQENMNLAEAAEALAKVGMAVHDAFISCWNTKYTHWWLRPETYINRVIHTSGDWVPYLFPTPNFPEYTSGHSTEAGASAKVMFDTWGNIPFTDHTHDAIGLPPRSFDTFEEAAREAVISRKYGGIHYDHGNNDGYDQGVAIGAQISALNWKTSTP